MELVSSAKLRARWAGTEVFFVLAGLLRYVRTGRRLQTAGAISVGFWPLYVGLFECLLPGLNVVLLFVTEKEQKVPGDTLRRVVRGCRPFSAENSPLGSFQSAPNPPDPRTR